MGNGEDKMSESKKSYIGDGVYADIEDGMIKLTTEDGIGSQNTIYLELPVFKNLVSFFNRIVKRGSKLEWIGINDERRKI